MNIKIFELPTKEWLNYVIRNRTNIEFALLSDYDIVIGPVVDGITSWITLNQYVNRLISFEETLELIKPKVLTDQWAFKTQKSINLLRYGGVYYERR